MAGGLHLHGQLAPLETRRKGDLDARAEFHLLHPTLDLIFQPGQARKAQPPQLLLHPLQLVVAAQPGIGRDPRERSAIKDIAEAHPIPQSDLLKPVEEIPQLVLPQFESPGQIQQRLTIDFTQPKPPLQGLFVESLLPPVGENRLIFHNLFPLLIQ